MTHKTKSSEFLKIKKLKTYLVSLFSMVREQVFFGPLSERDSLIKTIKQFIRHSQIEMINMAERRNLMSVSSDLTQESS